VLILGRAFVRRRRGGIPLIGAALLVAAAGINDMLFSSFIVSTGNLLPFAMGFFVFVQDLVLTRRTTTSIDRVEQLSYELGQSNEQLRREIDGHREAREKLETLLVEKETHLKEIHHRVKNSLQIVSSIAGLQSNRTDDARSARALNSLRERIRAISLVHEKLYGARSEELVNLCEYANELISRLMAGFGFEDRTRVELACTDIRVSMSLCIDLGLILSELAANAFLHAFGKEEGGLLHISVKEEDASLHVVVEDDGPGYPPGFSPDSGPTLGFKIVSSLVRKRGGRFALSSTPGARADVYLPLAGATADSSAL
jgi:two-component sensor histidine kinase